MTLMRCLDHCNYKWETDDGVELKCDREDGHTGVHAAMDQHEGRIQVCPLHPLSEEINDGPVGYPDGLGPQGPVGPGGYPDAPTPKGESRCFHCNRPLVDQGEDDPNVDRLALTMRFQKWSLDVSAITYLCACGANTTRLGNVTAAYHDTWDREFGD